MNSIPAKTLIPEDLPRLATSARLRYPDMFRDITALGAGANISLFDYSLPSVSSFVRRGWNIDRGSRAPGTGSSLDRIRRHMKPALLLLALAGCSNSPDWVLMEKQATHSIYVDKRSLKKEGGHARATLRGVFANETTASTARHPYWSLIMTVDIDCANRKWATVSFESFDRDGRTVEKRKGFDKVDYYVVPDWDGPRATPRLVCEHLNNGRPITRVGSDDA